ncbi:FAD-dependent oxidoreductase [Thiomicrorhabdus sp. ZW0627]|uniref:NAD(P)/FAD-dependent oxidoreductase n=1 Tax=Thiomicrorhabdus sp. ZW0627 TaxID=3039774 RepID=UPI002436CFDA|nr:FAD-dependent oxidoreductase [Thiomicrorhabdus sp. ZW0627]MDG6773742.1 FAD-dependent oxidoreductase [Thiomicrorhabdus sp. ZW0627]
MGAGYAGWQVAEAIRQQQPDSEITLLTACDGTVYPKPAISMALSQGRTPEDLKEASADEKAAQLDIGVKTRTKVMSINTKRKKVMTTTGSFGYDKLIIATGAKAMIPKIEGDAGHEVSAVNDLNAYRKFRNALEGKHSVTIIGGGLIATEMAEDLASQDIKVDLIVRGDHLMRQMLPGTIADTLESKLAEKGVKLHFNTQVEQMNLSDSGYRLSTNQNEDIQTEMVLSAIGLQPNIDIAKKAKLDTHVGVCINQYCQTSDPDVYALGDCSESNGIIQAYLEPIRRQAQTIAAHINGDLSQEFQIVPPLVKTKTPSLSIMMSPPLDSSQGQWEVTLQAGNDQKILYKNEDKVSGFALSGELASSANQLYKQLFSA